MKSALVEAGDGHPSDAPIFWYVSRLLDWHGYEVERVLGGGAPATPGPRTADLVVCAGDACIRHAERPGMFIAPDLDDDGLMTQLKASPGPLLLVGGEGLPGWSQARAVRVRQAEVLQLPRVDRAIGVPGDLSASLDVLATVLRRFEALIRSVDRRRAS